MGATWPLIVGYQHEVLHTGVLAHLACDPDRGARLASVLTGAPVVRVERIRQEAKVPGFAGRADLVAEAELEDGERVSLAIETKVDSNASRKQLAATAASPHLGVLLATGITALNLTQRDLGDGLLGWVSAGPSLWATALSAAGAADDPVLRVYVEEVEREACEHRLARELAGCPGDGCWLDHSRRGDGLLEHYAWLAEVRERLDDPAEWWTYTNRSGPLMGLWREDFQGLGRDTFIEVMCVGDRRRLCLKLGEGSGDLRTCATEALARVETSGWSGPARRASANAGTCTAAMLDLSKFSAEKAAARLRLAITEVAGEGGQG